MTFTDFYTKKIEEIIGSEKLKIKNPIFVLLGQAELFNSTRFEKYLVDQETFTLNANEDVFNKDWFARVFTTLNLEKEFHLISYAQFSYLIFYIDSSFFKDRIVILKDNLRQLFPIREEEFIEKTELESIEFRPDAIPIYQAEQVKINGQFFYSVKPPIDDFKCLDVFTGKKELTFSTNADFETIDISSDPYALDYFMNYCIAENNLSSFASITKFAKKPISSSITNMISSLNHVLSVFGGGLFYDEVEIVQKDYQPGDKTIEMLKKYWGQNASFRNLKVYANPDVGSQVTEISQGLIVETIIKEYHKITTDKKPRDLFLTAPTGSGKSLLFQLPAFYISEQNDVTIIVSPLIALMKDQVNAIIQDRKFEKVAYLNSELSLIDRDRIIENCRNNNIDILYMSPELLMSYDISHFIGDRRIGLLVIDEAHLITTWGRDFRVDYWFLGNHIRKIRKFHKMNFPMVAVTATAIYGGVNDMVFDSIDSLVMHDPHIFIGQVKREDITFLVNNHDKFEKNYEKSKLHQTVNFIKEIHEINIKTLIYTPYTKHIREILSQLDGENLDIAAGYYGSQPPDQKELSYRMFKSNEKKIMVSTKAFGMGVDISDIELIYHHAPSGLLPDYIQEIGRAARDESIKGYAALNYATQDQRFSKVLHGMSAIRQYQIREVLKKVYNIYIKNDKNRNILLSVDDFGYIFENSSDLDQKVLTSLMMIEKDYLAKYRFNVLIARPKKLFVKVFARISDNFLYNFQKKYSESFEVISSSSRGYKYIVLNLDKLWYTHFKEMSFPSLKYKYYTGQLFNDDGIELIPQLKMSFERLEAYQNVYNDLSHIFEIIKAVFVQFKGSYFTQKEFAISLEPYLKDIRKAEKLSNFILSTYSGNVLGPGIIQGNAFLARRKHKDEYHYRIFNTQYLYNFSSLLKRVHNLFGNTNNDIVEKFVTNKESNTENYIRLGYFLEILELGVFEIKGGENPMVFIRLNDPDRIKKDSNDPRYVNTLLSKTLDRYDLSNQIFDHFFLRSLSNEERWNFIEEYFLGDDVDGLISSYPGGESNRLDIVDYLKKNKKEKLINSRITLELKDSNIHIFKGRPDSFYRGKDLLTIEDEENTRTMKVSKWITTDPVTFDKERKKLNLKVDYKLFKILMSRLRNHHYEYYRDSLGLDLHIYFKGYDNHVKAIVPYNDKPVEFYKWYCENPEEVKLSIKDKVILFDRVNLTAPNVLKARHKKELGST